MPCLFFSGFRGQNVVSFCELELDKLAWAAVMLPTGGLWEALGRLAGAWNFLSPGSS